MEKKPTLTCSSSFWAHSSYISKSFLVVIVAVWLSSCQRIVSTGASFLIWPSKSLIHGAVCSFPFFQLEESGHGKLDTKFWRAGATKWKKFGSLNVAWRRVRHQSGKSVLGFKWTWDTRLSTLYHHTSMCWGWFVTAARVILTKTYVNWAELFHEHVSGFRTYFSLEFSIIHILKIIQGLNQVQLSLSSFLPSPSATEISLFLNFL